ncbi:phosphatidylserine decarboxylase 1 [Steccherinum ochraceum]|uniref:Phosphatidylserine decarboxylase proenzyme 1, mitochondrial n=1 Tax=Steccherinum ochraceum TaxID=92696 RepID=A0A4V2MXT7_9APHY|nr:phosphatidylserine decarboxylase 1 [Steccherinum ochraceum]
MLGVKVRVKKLLANGTHPFSGTLSSSPGFNVSTRIIERCLHHGHNINNLLFRRNDHRPYSTGSQGGEPSPGGSFGGKGTPLHIRLARAWAETPTKWYPLPIAVGALLLMFMQYRKRLPPREVHVDEEGREVVRLKGPWQVHVLGALPLRNLSRVWGYLNSVELPVWFRPTGLRVYSWIFGCNLDEIEHDLKSYKSLGDFFYRRLKAGARPPADSVLVSPADGTILHFGTIKNRRVEQVKGSTYSLDALLGVETSSSPPSTPVHFPERDMAELNDRHFADINGIEYSVQELLGASTPSSNGSATPARDAPAGIPLKENAVDSPKKHGELVDASVSDEQSTTAEVAARHASVAAEMGVRASAKRRGSGTEVKPGNELFFTVIYLAPGDYHRFHSPTAWVVEKRRHFVGDLFSVSPWMARRLENLFVLNERVALLGRWKYGFFSMVPVGATNVGSIRINFDQDLRTNVGSRRNHPTGTYTEAVYSAASPILDGQPLTKAQEMGGFCLGSTIVLIFEAPQDFQFSITEGQKVQVGQELGDVALNIAARRASAAVGEDQYAHETKKTK